MEKNTSSLAKAWPALRPFLLLFCAVFVLTVVGLRFLPAPAPLAAKAVVDPAFRLSFTGGCLSQIKDPRICECLSALIVDSGTINGAMSMEESNKAMDLFLSFPQNKDAIAACHRP